METIPGVGVCKFLLTEQEHNTPVNLAGIKDDQGPSRCLSHGSWGYFILLSPAKNLKKQFYQSKHQSVGNSCLLHILRKEINRLDR